jgi:hypothetical protein
LNRFSKIQLDCDEKYNKAKETIIQMVNQTKLKITDLELDVLIESVCNSLKKI